MNTSIGSTSPQGDRRGVPGVKTDPSYTNKQHVITSFWSLLMLGNNKSLQPQGICCRLSYAMENFIRLVATRYYSKRGVKMISDIEKTTLRSSHLHGNQMKPQGLRLGFVWTSLKDRSAFKMPDAK